MNRGALAFIALILFVVSVACIRRSPGTRYESSTEPLGEVQLRLRDELSRDVEALSVGIGPRNAGQSLEAVLAAESWIKDRLRADGIEPRREEIDIGVGTVGNVEVSFPGTTLAEEIVLIGAHYDTVYGSPGANDNASGVALLLAVAKRLATAATDRTVRVVFFVNEEEPFNGSFRMGSRVHADKSRARDDNIVLMINVDSVGYYAREKGSQNYPPLVGALFPSRGNFVVFATDKPNKRILDRVVGLFQEQCRFPSVGAATNSKQINRSDHGPFLWRGYPAIALSDTSEYRDPHYHLPTDIAGNLDYDELARMGDGFIKTVRVLASAGFTMDRN